MPWGGKQWVVVALALLGCANGPPRQGYDGPRRPRGEVAVIEGEDNMTFVGLDGLPTNIPPTEEGKAAAHRVEVLPGEHSIDVDWAKKSSVVQNLDKTFMGINFAMRLASPVRLTFEARAGREYQIKGFLEKRMERMGTRGVRMIVSGRAEIQLLDRKTGEILARVLTSLMH